MLMNYEARFRQHFRSATALSIFAVDTPPEIGFSNQSTSRKIKRFVDYQEFYLGALSSNLQVRQQARLQLPLLNIAWVVQVDLV